MFFFFFLLFIDILSNCVVLQHHGYQFDLLTLLSEFRVLICSEMANPNSVVITDTHDMRAKLFPSMFINDTYWPRMHNRWIIININNNIAYINVTYIIINVVLRVV